MRALWVGILNRKFCTCVHKFSLDKQPEIERRRPGKKILLPVCEVKILQHLDEVSRNRKEGALKGAETQKTKETRQSGSEQYYSRRK